MGAVTVANVVPGSNQGRDKVVEADVTFSSSYSAGGDTLNPRQLGLRGIREAQIVGRHIRTGKPIPNANLQTGKSIQLGGTETAPTLKLYDTANTESTAALSNAGVTKRVRFLGY